MFTTGYIERFLYSLPEYCAEIQRKNFIEIYSYNGLLATRKVIEFDGNTVLCRVCGDKASGFHYGVHACEGCKGFFRRSIQQKIQYRPCLKNQQCNIMRVNRNRCQYCRLKKCIAVGMSRDAVRFGRVPKREKAKIMEQMQRVNAQTQINQLSSIIENDSVFLQSIITAHAELCSYTRSKFQMFQSKVWRQPQYVDCPAHMACPLNPMPDQSDNIQKWDEFSDCFTPAIRNVVNFAKCIPGFQVFCQEDQVTLLKAGVFEVLLVHLTSLFDNSVNTMIFTNGKLYKKPSPSVTNSAGFLLDSMFDFADRLNQLQLTDEEVALFSALVLIAPDRHGLRFVDQISMVQQSVSRGLQSIMKENHPDDNAAFAKLLMKIPDLRTLNALHSEKLLGLTVQNGSSSSAASEAANTQIPWHKIGTAEPDRPKFGEESLMPPVSLSLPMERPRSHETIMPDLQLAAQTHGHLQLPGICPSLGGVGADRSEGLSPDDRPRSKSVGHTSREILSARLNQLRRRQDMEGRENPRAGVMFGDHVLNTIHQEFVQSCNGGRIPAAPSYQEQLYSQYEAMIRDHGEAEQEDSLSSSPDPIDTDFKHGTNSLPAGMEIPRHSPVQIVGPGQNQGQIRCDMTEQAAKAGAENPLAKFRKRPFNPPEDNDHKVTKSWDYDMRSSRSNSMSSSSSMESADSSYHTISNSGTPRSSICEPTTSRLLYPLTSEALAGRPPVPLPKVVELGGQCPRSLENGTGSEAQAQAASTKTAAQPQEPNLPTLKSMLTGQSYTSLRLASEFREKMQCSEPSNPVAASSAAPVANPESQNRVEEDMDLGGGGSDRYWLKKKLKLNYSGGSHRPGTETAEQEWQHMTNAAGPISRSVQSHAVGDDKPVSLSQNVPMLGAATAIGQTGNIPIPSAVSTPSRSPDMQAKSAARILESSSTQNTSKEEFVPSKRHPELLSRLCTAPQVNNNYLATRLLSQYDTDDGLRPRAFSSGKMDHLLQRKSRLAESHRPRAHSHNHMDRMLKPRYRQQLRNINELSKASGYQGESVETEAMMQASREQIMQDHQTAISTLKDTIMKRIDSQENLRAPQLYASNPNVGSGSGSNTSVPQPGTSSATPRSGFVTHTPPVTTSAAPSGLPVPDATAAVRAAMVQLQANGLFPPGLAGPQIPPGSGFPIPGLPPSYAGLVHPALLHLQQLQVIQQLQAQAGNQPTPEAANSATTRSNIQLNPSRPATNAGGLLQTQEAPPSGSRVASPMDIPHVREQGGATRVSAQVPVVQEHGSQRMTSSSQMETVSTMDQASPLPLNLTKKNTSSLSRFAPPQVKQELT